MLTSVPPAVLRPPADILVYINDSCVLGHAHKEVVDLLKSVPMGQSVDVVLRRGYPMLYNPDGCPKQSLQPVGAAEVAMAAAVLGPVCLTCPIRLPLRQPQTSHSPLSPPAVSPLTYSPALEADGGAPHMSKLLPLARFAPWPLYLHHTANVLTC